MKEVIIRYDIGNDNLEDQFNSYCAKEARAMREKMMNELPTPPQNAVRESNKERERERERERESGREGYTYSTWLGVRESRNGINQNRTIKSEDDALVLSNTKASLSSSSSSSLPLGPAARLEALAVQQRELQEAISRAEQALGDLKVLQTKSHSLLNNWTD